MKVNKHMSAFTGISSKLTSDFGVYSYVVDAIMSFLKDTPFSTGTLSLDAFVTAVIIGLLSVVPDMGYLAKASATGLTVLFITFCVIASYGQYSGFGSLNWWPTDGMVGISQWFGCVVFGFGMVPLTYNMQEAMAEPQRMLGAATMGMISVAAAYATLGLGLLLLYPNIEGDVLQELPTQGIAPTAVRLAMVLVVMVTAPLLVVPCAELLEGKLLATGFQVPGSIPIIVRLGICVICSVISVWVPGFVNVLSFVGCFCVALVSFVVPPLLHYVLLRKNETRDLTVAKRAEFLDLAMVLWGISATIITSIFTLREMT